MPLWTTDVVVAIILLVTSELAFRAGRRSRTRGDDRVRSQITALQASSLGLLALILGFTMSMAESRFAARRVVVLSEANAVGTTYRRVDLLPEPVRTQSRELVRSYVDARRAYYRASIDEVDETIARAQDIHRRLYALAVSIAPAHLDSDVLALYLEALDEMIELEATRTIVIASRLPWSIRAVLALIAFVAIGVSGYATGLGGARVAISVWLLPALIALAYSVIADLDRSRAGVITTGDAPMARIEAIIDAERRASGTAFHP